MRVRASWRGVSFEVDNESESGGGRLQVWEYPDRDDASGADLGARARRLSLTGYLNGDNLDAQRSAMMAALATRGPGLLVHPTLGPLSVFLDEYTRTESIDDDRSVQLELVFVEATGEIVEPAIDPTGALSTAGDTALTGIAAALQFLAETDAAQAALVATMRGTTADIRRFTTNNPVARQITRISELADALDDLDDAITDLANSPAAWAAALQNAMLLIGSTAAFRLMTDDASAVETDANAEANRQMYVQSSLAMYAVALSQELAAERWTRQEALAELATLTSRIDTELDRGAPAALYSVRVAVASEVSARIAQLPDVTTITLDTPSSWLAEAWRLYGSTSQAEDLWRINGRGDPSQIVGTLEVYA